MNKYDDLITLLDNGTPFSFNRFNDGEMMGIEKVGSVAARGDQVISVGLHNKLCCAILHTSENYWIGKPCSVCFPRLRKLYDTYVKPDYEYQTHAVQFCNNGNWEKSIKDFNKILKKRKVVWISGNDQNLKKLEFHDNIYSHITVPIQDSWQAYEKVKHSWKDFNPSDVVISSCGPLSRVLTYEWSTQRKDCTFLDLGSLFDPFTRNVWHKCHTGKLVYCPECNRG